MRVLSLLCLSGFVSLLACADSVWAQSLADPTKPGIVLKSDASAAEPDGAESSGPRLQMVVMRPKRARALLNGVWVEQGSVWGAYRVLQIKAESVILKGSAGREEVRLTPAVELRPVDGGKLPSKSEKSRKASVLVEASKAGSAASPARATGGSR